MARIKAKNLDKELSRELLKEIDAIADGVKDKAVLQVVGNGIVEEMKSMISKGISPIEGAGRFPEYKAKAKQREVQKATKGPKNRPRKSQSRREERGPSGRVRKKKDIKGYPYTVQKKFPNKKPRPVNLFLSGKFLAGLKAFVIGSDQAGKLAIGFDDFQLEQIEEGHRVGWLGQGKRPIIPQQGEKFAQRIQRVAERILGQVIATKLLTRRR